MSNNLNGRDAFSQAKTQKWMMVFRSAATFQIILCPKPFLHLHFWFFTIQNLSLGGSHGNQPCAEQDKYITKQVVMLWVYGKKRHFSTFLYFKTCGWRSHWSQHDLHSIWNDLSPAHKIWSKHMVRSNLIKQCRSCALPQ